MKINEEEKDRIYYYLAFVGVISCISFAVVMGISMSLFIMSAVENIVWKLYVGLFLLAIAGLIGWITIRLFKFQEKFQRE